MAPPEAKYNRGLWSLCHPFTPYCCSLSPDPMGYYDPNPWCDVAKKIMDKYKCPEHLVPMPPKNPEKIDQVFDKFKTLGNFLGVAQCHAYQYGKTLVLHSRGLGDFPKDPVHITLLEAKPNPREVVLGHSGRESSHLQRGLTVMSSKIF